VHWLKKEACGWQLCFCILGCLALHIVYTIGILVAVFLLKIQIPPTSGERIQIFTISFPFALFGCAIVEEAIFRLPLAIFVAKGWTVARVLIVAIVFSVVFGVVHGSIRHIFLQGMGGFMYSVLFLKAGGLQGENLKAIATTATTHFLYNAILVGCAITRGATSF
jgi:membrane protease YdiL (CAAX protease family)